VRSHNMFQMDNDKLATFTPGFLVEYHEMRRPEFNELKRCLGVLFLYNGMSGSRLVGDHAVSGLTFFEIAVDILSADHICCPTITYKSSLRRHVRIGRI
jgi:hypothetical protein